MEKPQTQKTTKNLEIAALTLRASFSPESIDEKNRIIELRWSTGARVRTFSWETFTEFNEELSLNPEHIRMERMNSGAPLLDAHWRNRITDQIGVVEPGSLRFVGNEAFAKVRFSDREDVEPIWRDVKNGIIRNVSVGYRVYKYEDVTENDDKIKTLKAIDWEPMELSLVPVGADAGAGVRAAENKNECVFIVTKEEKKERVMDKVETPAEVKKVEVDADKIRKESIEEATQQERKRASQILTLVRKHNLGDDLGNKLIADGVNMDKANEAVLDALAERSDKNPIRSQVSVGRDISVESRREGMSEAIMHRADPSRKLPDVAKEYRGMTLMDMARESIEATGGRSRGLSRREIAMAALNLDHASRTRAGMQSTSDFPEILANTVNRTLRSAYELAPRTFLPFCRRATAPDFKQIARTQLSELSQFQAVGQGAEYKSVVFGEGAEKYSLGKYGGIIRLTWESIINDDLDAFSRIPAAIAAEAAATEADVVYAILTGNPDMADGTDLFHANHANYTSSGTAISDTSLGVARALMRKQTGIKGRKLNLVPKFLIVGPDKESEANKYTSVQYVASSPSSINPPFNTSLTPIVDPRISGNKWFMAAEPTLVDTIEYAYLEGEEGIYTEQRMGFEVDGLEVKARHVFAAKAIDYRSLYYNVGA